jgi:hypothetical protein
MVETFSRRALVVALVAMAIVWAWQALTVHFNYHGEWTGLFCIGDKKPLPPAIAAEHPFLFVNTYGYDGQFYHALAHDPWLTRGYAESFDAPLMRSRRILMSALAWLAAFGRDKSIDRGLIGVSLLFIGLGAYCTARLSAANGRSPWWGLFYIALPPVLTSIDRTLTDGPLTALVVGFLWFAHERRWIPLWIVCALAALTRETGMGLAPAAALYFLWRRDIGRAAAFACSLAPALAWYWYCAQHTSASMEHLGFAPFVGLVQRLLELSHYQLPHWIDLTVAFLDHLALIGVLMTYWAVWHRLRSRDTSLAAFALYVYAGLPAILRPGGDWYDGYAFGRTLGPFLILCAADVFETGTAAGVARAVLPAALQDPRIMLQWAVQVLTVARGLLGIG